MGKQRNGDVVAAKQESVNHERGLRYDYLLLRMIHNVDLPIVSHLGHRDRCSLLTSLGLCALSRNSYGIHPQTQNNSTQAIVVALLCLCKFQLTPKHVRW